MPAFYFFLRIILLLIFCILRLNISRLLEPIFTLIVEQSSLQGRFSHFITASTQLALTSIRSPTPKASSRPKTL